MKQVDFEAMHDRSDDAARFVRGRGRYSADIEVPGALHAAFVRAPAGPGAIAELPLDDAAAAPGVVAVLSGRSLAFAAPPPFNPVVPNPVLANGPLLPTERAAAPGQPLAIVLAESPSAAADAAAEVFASIDTEAESAAQQPFAWHTGDVAAAFQRAHTIVEAETIHARLAPSPMEPRAAIAIPDGGGERLHLIAPVQAPWRTRDALAAVLGLSAENVRVTAPDVGGAFGMKAGLEPEYAILAAAALRLGRAVRWVATRSEDFIAASQGRGAHLSGRLALDRDGRFLGLKATASVPVGYHLHRSALVPLWNACRILPGPYSVPAILAEGAAQQSATPPVAIYRGAGRPEAALLMERLVDEAAHTLGLDPVEIRKRNTVNDFPHRRDNGVELDSGDYARLLNHPDLNAVWQRGIDERDARRARSELIGLGLALYVEPSGQGDETAALTLCPDGTIAITTGSTCQGQRRGAVVRNVLAERLGLEPERFSVSSGDTASLSNALGALASRSTPIGLPAVLLAVDAFTDEVKQAAARLAGTNQPERFVIGDDGARDGENLIDWRTLAAAGISVERTYTASGEAWGSGAVVCLLAVDRQTGTIAIETLLALDDAGQIIDPQAAHDQVVGGAAQGFGEAMMEALRYDEGELLTGSFMDYALPRADDMPDIALASIETPAPGNPTGAKGIGEAGCIGVPAAILNATYNALEPLGVRQLDFPLTPHRIWEAMRKAER